MCIRDSHAAVRVYLAALEELAGTYALSNDVTVTALTRYPDVLTSEREEADAEELTGDVLAAVSYTHLKRRPHLRKRS